MNDKTTGAIEALVSDWSSHDIDHLLSLFTDDCIYEDVTFGVVNRGKAELSALKQVGLMPAT
jgi:ketosteroid isomerase-like protein